MLGFLHTAASHVPTFERLARDADPALSCRHAVEAPLLAAATAAGGVDAALAARIAARVDALRAAGARVVVCTCSTIGDAAEAASRPQAPVLRIDRPMAEAAVRRGARVAVVAALDTALAATVALLRAVAREQGRAVAIAPVLCAAAWPRFVAGDLAAYAAATAAAARAAAPAVDVVVLGQVSMAPAIERLADLATPVLAATPLGVQVAVERCRALRAPAPGGSAAARRPGRARR
ncbi:hypothetical protein KF840_20305 [bacterium]|nr:hypothetical protein [bacterium]